MNELTRTDLDRIANIWLERIAETDKREKAWFDDAKDAEAAYLCGTTESNEDDVRNAVPDFNIIHSNVETIVPAVYNSTPNPDIRPRHGNRDGAAKEISDALERAISTQIDDDKLNTEVEALAQDSVLAGRGITRIRFEADEVQGTPTNERVVYENVSWRDYREGLAKRWRDVPWLAYAHHLSNEDAETLSDDAIREVYAQDQDNKNPEDENLDVTMWEVWCKETRKVYFIVESTRKVIKIKEDPLGLKGFFPQPNTVQPITGTGRRLPVCPHKVYETLSKELDITTRRISAIVKGLKVRGIVAGSAEAVEDLAKAGDNELVPVADLEGLIAQGGLEKAVMWWPIDQAIQVLQQLYVQRDQIKQTIYEVTGISDIIRGASDAQETAAAQKIKTQWGSQRIKRLQRMVQSHVRDLFVMTAEIMVKKFQPASLQKAAGTQLTPEALQLLEQLDHFRIDVETDSTIRADLTFQRQEMSEFLRATGEFFSVMAPVLQQAPEITPAVTEMFASFAGSFQLGKRAEDALDQMTQMAQQAGQEQKPDPEAEERKANMAIEGEKLKIEGQRAQADFMKAQADAQAAQQKLSIEGQKAQAEMLLKRMDVGIKAQQLGLAVDKQALERQKAEFDAFMRQQELQIERTQQRPVAV